MTNKLPEINEPLNSNERYLYVIACQQKILIEQVNSIIDYIASKENVAVTTTKHVESKASDFKEEAPKSKEEETVVQAEPSSTQPKKRAPRKKKEVEKEVE